jgi:hypothetical protein
LFWRGDLLGALIFMFAMSGSRGSLVLSEEPIPLSTHNKATSWQMTTVDQTHDRSLWKAFSKHYLPYAQAADKEIERQSIFSMESVIATRERVLAKKREGSMPMDVVVTYAEPSPESIFELLLKLFERATAEDDQPLKFVDFGSGFGKPCFAANALATASGQNIACVGVEYMPERHNVAVHASVDKPNLVFVRGDFSEEVPEVRGATHAYSFDVLYPPSAIQSILAKLANECHTKKNVVWATAKSPKWLRDRLGAQARRNKTTGLVTVRMDESGLALELVDQCPLVTVTADKPETFPIYIYVLSKQLAK